MTTKFTAEHEWINIEDHEAAVVGITLHAQDALGDVVFVDLPEVGETFAKGEVAGVVESVKAAADLFMPVGGEIVEVPGRGRRDLKRLLNEGGLPRFMRGRLPLLYQGAQLLAVPSLAGLWPDATGDWQLHWMPQTCDQGLS